MNEPSDWRLETLAGCRLAIGGYPTFLYDARGGEAHGQAQPIGDGALALVFTPEQVRIPALERSSTRLLGLPLPPGLRIEILAERLAGRIDPVSGAVRLEFEARFRFRLQLSQRPVLTPPDLIVRAELTSGVCRSARHDVQGRRRHDNGETTLVGVARVPPSGATWLDRFLGLPDEALAVLHCRLGPAAQA